MVATSASSKLSGLEKLCALFQENKNNIGEFLQTQLNVDKTKLLQVFVNLLTNAKDAVMQSSLQNKVITIKTIGLNKDKMRIEISDNGVGILPQNKDKIFRYGFTTKQYGHGFGLQTSALTINAIGGSIHAESAGCGKGTKMTVDIPYNHVNQ